ncbi:hypothetical protein PVK06_016960 [Gossypium arboreum]|uniref:Uncharacterized protein n=1 Tax=Gossypium arboreum TaxID=29729 RepID=A0ABR0Q280_GOSAR|nr:hypothetical protein PVK06_016960 [Gossypium arboreum]
MERESINALLCFLKLFPNLERLYIPINPKCYDMPSTGKLSTFVIVPGKLNDLKTVKLEGFADEKKEIFMARRLLPLFGDNNPIIISKSKGKYLKHLVKVAKLEKKGKYPLEHFLDISNFSPSKFIVTESGESIPNEAYTLFAKQDCALASWILSTVSPDILPQLVGAKTSAFVWSTLAHLFLYLSITKVMHLYCKLRSHRKVKPTSQGPQPLPTLFPDHVLLIPVVAETEPVFAYSANFVAGWDIL